MKQPPLPTQPQPNLICKKAFADHWPAIDAVKGYLIPGQERWLYDAVRNLPQDAVIVEIGSYMGRSTTAMAFACSGTERRIFAIDTFAGNSSDFIKGQNNVDWDGAEFLATFKSNLEANGLLEYVSPVKGDSSHIGAAWDKPIDFLFVDGSHVFEDVVSDFELFYPWVKPGGLVAFHDVQPEWEGPFRAWNEVIRHRAYRPSHFFSIAYGRKPHDGRSYQGTGHVIIPVHNRRPLTEACLRTLRGQTISDRIKVHVVDDGSIDGTADVIASEFPDVSVIEGDGNLWWTGAVAKALDSLRSTFRSDDYFLLVNNDSALNAETVEILVRESTRLNRAAVAPVALCGDQAISTGWGAGTTGVLNDFAKQFETMRLRENALETQSIFGRCSLYPVEILNEIGNFDATQFPHYHGDTDFALRAHKSGLRFFITGCTCIRVREDKHSTGSHFEYRQGPQPWKAVKDNMMSIKSIDNVKVNWWFLSRHHPDQSFTSTVRIAWSSIKMWWPVYRVRKIVGPYVGPLRQIPRAFRFLKRSIVRTLAASRRLLFNAAWRSMILVYRLVRKLWPTA